jgi:hypothetical protein
MLCVFVPVVKVQLPRFVAFGCPDVFRFRILRLPLDCFYAVAAFAVFVLAADYADIHGAGIFLLLFHVLRFLLFVAGRGTNIPALLGSLRL